MVPQATFIQVFNTRLNMLSEAFKVLVKTMIQSFRPEDCDSLISIVDSTPIVTCKGKNWEGKIATEITLKGYCSTKNMYYYGVKLHMVGQLRKGKIPFPEMIVLTSASENDLTVFKNECVPYLNGKTVLADKIYSDFSFFGDSNPVKVLTPYKEIKNEPKVIRQREKAARDLFSQAVSKLRQPIERKMVHELADDDVRQYRSTCHAFADRNRRKWMNQNLPFLWVFPHIGLTYHFVTDSLQDIYFCRNTFQA